MLGCLHFILRGLVGTWDVQNPPEKCHFSSTHLFGFPWKSSDILPWEDPWNSLSIHFPCEISMPAVVLVYTVSLSLRIPRRWGLHLIQSLLGLHNLTLNDPERLFCVCFATGGKGSSSDSITLGTFGERQKVALANTLYLGYNTFTHLPFAMERSLQPFNDKSYSLGSVGMLMAAVPQWICEFFWQLSDGTNFTRLTRRM